MRYNELIKESFDPRACLQIIMDRAAHDFGGLTFKLSDVISMGLRKEFNSALSAGLIRRRGDPDWYEPVPQTN